MVCLHYATTKEIEMKELNLNLTEGQLNTLKMSLRTQQNFIEEQLEVIDHQGDDLYGDYDEWNDERNKCVKLLAILTDCPVS